MPSSPLVSCSTSRLSAHSISGIPPPSTPEYHLFVLPPGAWSACAGFAHWLSWKQIAWLFIYWPVSAEELTFLSRGRQGKETRWSVSVCSRSGHGERTGLWPSFTYRGCWKGLSYAVFVFQKTCRNLICLKFLSFCEIGLILVSGFRIYQERTDRHIGSYRQCNCTSLIFSRNHATKNISCNRNSLSMFMLNSTALQRVQ